MTVFLNTRFLVELVITPIPVMILTRYLDQSLNLKREFDGDVVSENYDVIAFFQFKTNLGAIQKPDSRRIVCKTYFLINNSLLSYKNGKQNLKISHTALTLLL